MTYKKVNSILEDNIIPEEYEKDPVKWLFKRYDDASEKTEIKNIELR